jgi:hypothetical protein
MLGGTYISGIGVMVVLLSVTPQILFSLYSLLLSVYKFHSFVVIMIHISYLILYKFSFPGVNVLFKIPLPQE